jgi:hypothetical protein
MNFEQWMAAAVAEVQRIYSIDAAGIAERAWRQLYNQNHSPRAAADRAEVLFVNALPAAERLRYRVIPRLAS